MSVLIVKHWNPESEHSPEFRYLNDILRADARRVFGRVVLTRWVAGDPHPAIDDGDYVLVLGEANVWITRATLTLMKTAVDGGAPVAAPAPLNADMIGDMPIYTPSDFERLEQRTVPVRGGARTALPVSLWSTAALRAELAGEPVSRLLVDSRSLPGGAQCAGIYLPFADYYGEARADLLPFLPERADRVLEVGCGRGLTGALIQERLGCRVTGVEQHPGVAAEAARRLSRVLVGDVSSVEIDGSFDAIVASELIEHVADPEAVLLKMKALLAPGGRIVLSVPNVGHYSIVEDLLAGRWDYVPAGLLCVTHLRFFTRRTLEDMAARLGFTCEMHPQSGELPDRFGTIPAAFGADTESLRTKGFYVVLTPVAH